VRLDPVHVVLSVPDRDVVALSEGTEVEVTVPAVPKPQPGKIIRINPTGDQETRAFRAEVEVDNADMKVLPGMIASVRLDRTLQTGGVVIPQDWLITRRDGVGVFLENDAVAHYRPVKAGRVVRDQVIIDEGLQAGDRIVIKGHRQLADGDSLVITREGQCCKRGRVAFE
jgi:RND family efflux transporter MFP subunit